MLNKNGKPKKGYAKFFVIFSLGVIFAALFNTGLHYTNRTEFCVSCHSMQNNFEQLKETVHWKSASGVHAGCPDCHVPKAFLPKMQAKLFAVKDIYHEIMGTVDTKEKFEAHKWEMANRVWKKMKETDSRECRSCHSFDHMDFDEQDKMASKKHPKAIKRGQTCIDCHKGIAHEEPDEPDDA